MLLYSPDSTAGYANHPADAYSYSRQIATAYDSIDLLASPGDALWDGDKHMSAVAVGPISSVVMPVAIVMMMPIRMVPIVFPDNDGGCFRPLRCGKHRP